MKLKDKKELHSKTVSELKKLLKDAQEALFSLRIEHEQNKLKNTTSLNSKRKEIAVLKTILTEKVTAEKRAEEKVVEEKTVVKKGVTANV